MAVLLNGSIAGREIVLVRADASLAGREIVLTCRCECSWKFLCAGGSIAGREIVCADGSIAGREIVSMMQVGMQLEGKLCVQMGV